jgi:hypothetical protein
MKGKTTDKKGKGISIKLVKLGSLLDLARNACTFSTGARPVFMIKKDGRYLVVTLGIHIGETRTAFYAESKKSGNFLLYCPKSPANGEETAEIVESPESYMADQSSYKIPIVGISGKAFVEEKDYRKGRVECVEALDPGSVVRSVIGRASEDEAPMPKVYSFTYKSERYIGSFQVLEDEDIKVFCYAKAGTEKAFSFFRYNYTDGRLDQTDSLGEHSFIYTRVINLAEPFPFFKPD